MEITCSFAKPFMHVLLQKEIKGLACSVIYSNAGIRTAKTRMIQYQTGNRARVVVQQKKNSDWGLTIRSSNGIPYSYYISRTKLLGVESQATAHLLTIPSMHRPNIFIHLRHSLTCKRTDVQMGATQGMQVWMVGLLTWKWFSWATTILVAGLASLCLLFEVYKWLKKKGKKKEICDCSGCDQ